MGRDLGSFLIRSRVHAYIARYRDSYIGLTSGRLARQRTRAPYSRSIYVLMTALTSPTNVSAGTDVRGGRRREARGPCRLTRRPLQGGGF